MLGRALGTSPQNLRRGQPGHVGQIPRSDWSKFQILRSDWSGSKPMSFTTHNPRTVFFFWHSESYVFRPLAVDAIINLSNNM